MNASRREFVVGAAAVGASALMSGCGLAKKAHPAEYTTKTAVYYTQGGDSWDYGNQQKEFDANTDCYVRITSMVYAANITASKGDEIAVKYAFSGTDVADVVIADGPPMQIEQSEDEENVIVYTYTAKAKDKDDDTEDYSIFKYIPAQDGSVTLSIEYGDEIDENEDWQSTIYFTGTAQRETTEVPNIKPSTE